MFLNGFEWSASGLGRGGDRDGGTNELSLYVHYIHNITHDVLNLI